MLLTPFRQHRSQLERTELVQRVLHSVARPKKLREHRYNSIKAEVCRVPTTVKLSIDLVSRPGVKRAQHSCPPISGIHLLLREDLADVLQPVLRLMALAGLEELLLKLVDRCSCASCVPVSPFRERSRVFFSNSAGCCSDVAGLCRPVSFSKATTRAVRELMPV